MKKQPCPRCGSTHIEIESDADFAFLICLDCGFDQSDEYETPNDRKGKEGKGTPYKRGGGSRTQKR